MGLNDEEVKKCCDEVGLTSSKVMFQSLLPQLFGRGIEPNIIDFIKLSQKGKKMGQKVSHRPVFMKGIPKSLANVTEVVNKPFMRRSELPSANFHSSARSLAKIAAIMANYGEGMDNDRLMTHETWLKMHAEEKRAFDAAMHSK